MNGGRGGPAPHLAGVLTQGRTTVRARAGDGLVAVLDTVPDRAAGRLRVWWDTSVVHPAHRRDAALALGDAATAMGLVPDALGMGEPPPPSTWRIVDGNIVAWVEEAPHGLTVHARELSAEGPVATMRTMFERRADRDGRHWWFVGPVAIQSPFPRRGSASAAYDLVEAFTGEEARPNGWRGAGGILCGEAIYVLWRRRLAARGVDADRHLWPMMVRHLRDGMDRDALSALDAEVAGAVAEAGCGLAEPGPSPIRRRGGRCHP